MIGVTLMMILLSGSMAAQYNVDPLYRLLRRLSTQLPSNTAQEDELLLLGELVDDAILEKQRLARGLLISNLVWEQYETQSTLETAVQEAGITFEYPLFTCCCGRYANGVDGHQLCRNLEEALDTMQTFSIAAKRHGQDRFTLLINHTASCSVDALLSSVFLTLDPSGLHAGVSDPGTDALHLSKLHEQARSALQYAVEQQLPLAAYAALPPKEEPPAEQKEPPKETALKERILTCMQSNLRDNSLSLESIAGACGISASYLVRYFRSCMGVTPMQYVDTLRMNIAKELLTTTSRTLRQVVGQSGNLDESNVARKIQRQEGMTPMNYRKEFWQANRPENMQKMT